MSTPMDHIAYLSQEIGPRPAGTEEEQQAALYITERLQKDAHLSAQIEDFTCNSNALMTPIICYGVAIVAVLLGIILPVIAIPAQSRTSPPPPPAWLLPVSPFAKRSTTLFFRRRSRRA